MLPILSDFIVAHGDGGDLLSLLVELVIFCIVLGLLWWIISLIPLPPPAKQIVTVVFVVIVALIAIGVLLGFTGHPVFR